MSKKIISMTFCILFFSACSANVTSNGADNTELYNQTDITYFNMTNADTSSVMNTSIENVGQNEIINVDSEIINADYQYLYDIGIIDLLEKRRVFENFSHGIYSTFSFEHSEIITDENGNEYQALIIPVENINNQAIADLSNLFGDLSYNDNGYYECPIKNIDAYYNVYNSLYTNEYVERLLTNVQIDVDTIKTPIENNEILYFYSGAGYDSISFDYQSARITSTDSDLITVEFDYESLENDISYSTVCRFVKEDTWKIDNIECN